MPTGYTAIIEDKPETTFREFALRCARGMGACISMREDSLDAPPPHFVEPDHYHEQKQLEAEKELQILQHLSAAEVEIRCVEYNRWHAEQSAACEKSCNEQRELYLSMLRQVDAWQPPSPDHENFKKFMHDQLVCGGGLDYDRIGKPFVVLEPQQWLAEQTEHKTWEVDYHQKAWEEEQARVADRTRWLQLLWASLGELDEGSKK